MVKILVAIILVPVVLYVLWVLGLNLWVYLYGSFLTVRPAPECSDIKKGCRFRVREPVTTRFMTYWEAPFTGGGVLGLPQGLVIVAIEHTPPKAGFIRCVAEDSGAFEESMIADSRLPRYAGYSIILRCKDIGEKVEILD